ncbi:hypothetical protein KSS87_013066 [Heliosperma pusillum]|nr:hypothetical protein KSS87_013066 [Heliosperma pusillum]
MSMVAKEESQVTVAAKVNLPQTLSPDSAVPVSHTDREVNASIALEKPSEDGFNWRKYGQKNVKGNEYIRSYYKCSYPNCCVKKQIERSHDGRITDVTYLGNHEHAKPHAEPKGAVPSQLSVPLQLPECLPSAVDEDKPSDKHSPGTDDVRPMNVETAIVAEPDDTMSITVTPLNVRRDEHNESLTPKRRKKAADAADITPEKPGQESRLVVQTVSEVDIVNDGYRWRKYGQKMVKGNPNPRSYYRCSTAGCPAKKHVERASYDPKVVIATYEGQHDHNIPPVRTIVPQSPAPSSGGTESNGVEKSKPEESNDARDPTTEDNNTPPIAVKSENEKLSPDNNEGHKAHNGDSVDRMTEETAQVQVETTSEVAKIEQKDAETDSNGVEKTDGQPANC